MSHEIDLDITIPSLSFIDSDLKQSLKVEPSESEELFDFVLDLLDKSSDNNMLEKTFCLLFQNVQHQLNLPPIECITAYLTAQTVAAPSVPRLF
jgi:hypothetical protein